MAGVLAAAVAGCAPAPADPVKLGKVYFTGFDCVKCHRIGEEGGTRGPDLTFIGFRKSRAWLDVWLKSPPAWRHDTTMPSYYLKDNVRAALLEFLAAQKGQAFAGRFPWDAAEFQNDHIARGRMIFEKAGCYACHGKDGKGGYPNNNVQGGLIPPLATVGETYTKDELRDKVILGVKPEKKDPNGPEPLIVMPSWGEVLGKKEVDDLVEYLFSLAPKKKEDAW